MSADPVVVHVARNEVEAELACARLRQDGIKCGHRLSNIAAGAGDGLAGLGPHEVLVAADDADAARELLA